MATAVHAESCPPPAGTPVTATPSVRPGHEKRFEPLLQKINQLAKQKKFAAIGVGDSIMQRWPQPLLESGLGVETLNAGVGGDTAAALLWRLENMDWAAQSPRYVLVVIGTNDLVRNTTCDVLYGLRAVTEKLRKTFPAAKIVVTSILPRGESMSWRQEDIRFINQSLKNSAKPAGYTFFDAHDAFLCGGVTPCDLVVPPANVHPTRKGYEILADSLKAVLAGQGK